MSTRSHLKPLAAAAGALALLLTGCSSDATGAASVPAQQPTAAANSSTRVVDGAEGLKLAARDGATVIDVRTPQEFADGHLDGARNIPLDGFGAAVDDLPRHDTYVLYCRTGNRSAQAAHVMHGLGFPDVADAGSLDALAAAGGRVIT
jgi:phage shock protein E